jgi:hypothetical protein
LAWSAGGLEASEVKNGALGDYQGKEGKEGFGRAKPSPILIYSSKIGQFLMN